MQQPLDARRRAIAADAPQRAMAWQDPDEDGGSAPARRPATTSGVPVGGRTSGGGLNDSPPLARSANGLPAAMVPTAAGEVTPFQCPQCDSGHRNIATLLLEVGADVNATTCAGYTPLQAACEGGHVKLVQLLLGFGANVRITAKDGRNPLHFAVHGDHGDIAALLLKAGVDVNAALERGDTPLHLASLNGHSSVVELLCKAGANVNAELQKGGDLIGFTPLHFACHAGHEDTVARLRHFGSNLNAVTQDGWTPIGIASAKGHAAVVEMLGSRDVVNINAAAFTGGRTSLHLACARAHLDVVQVLLELGADVNAKTDIDSTVLHIACAKGNVPLVRMLCESGANVDAV